MIKFWKKVSNTLAAVVENISEYKTYQFKLLKVSKGGLIQAYFYL